jgi:hypothetical protein
VLKIKLAKGQILCYSDRLLVTSMKMRITVPPVLPLATAPDRS